MTVKQLREQISQFHDGTNVVVMTDFGLAHKISAQPEKAMWIGYDEKFVSSDECDETDFDSPMTVCLIGQ